MVQRIKLGEGQFKGGLKENTQQFKLNYLPEAIINDIEYSDKIELVLITPSKRGDQSYHSLRMVNPEQLKLFINTLIKGYAYFLLKKGRLNLITIKSIPFLFKQKLEEEIRKNWRTLWAK